MPASEWQEEQSGWNQEQQELADYLILIPASRTPHCLNDEALLDYLAKQQKHPNASSIVQHLADCLYCAQRLKRARESYGEAAALAIPRIELPQPGIWAGAASRWFAGAAFACLLCALLLMWWGALPTRQSSQADFLASLLAASKRQQQRIDDLQQKLNTQQLNSTAKPPTLPIKALSSSQEQQMNAKLGALQKANAALQAELQAKSRVSDAETEDLRHTLSRADTQLKQLRQRLALLTPSAAGLQVAFNVPEDVRKLRSGVFAVRGGEDPAQPTVTLLYPLEERVLDTRPTFRWQKMDGATSCSVWIYDAASQDSLSIDRAENLNAVEWLPNVPLVPGKVYAWQVSAMLPTGPVSAPRTKFRVATRAEAAQPALPLRR